MGERAQAIGRRIRRLRESKGLSRQDIASHLGVDLTAISAWERGDYLPREGRRVRLGAMLGIDVGSLFAEEQDAGVTGQSASLLDTAGELPGILRELTGNARTSLRAFRLAAPYATPPHVQEEFRSLLDQRLRNDSLLVQRIEIFYSLKRLQEVLANIIRYDGRSYAVKSYCAGVREVVPGMGGYIFDDHEVLVGAYWANIPPQRGLGLRLTGEPFRTYFTNYWSEVWQRGTLLNRRGALDLSVVRAVALELGLDPALWTKFVDEAHQFRMDDDLPPLI
ncbi:MAG: helix-turn-helix domain-containing protein [Alphaproteobacteria bacterium]|nr:helix-turn-helix domain-containing protein [Alphaproteobacteria bacterium]MBU6472227.1 helix-turn-helix domain-containing protein [Alphaproteobacteria bacterium]MDE2013324.1 helix-turn-helix domain-containing protein [Alphaproteobacteria bacterium]MDE2072260.1 helix-turn-helix domain-containing protein [Alphaproteobacteria bacterium]MDE2350273.1 helix-turn-helix domain-containing protein [Alphaproteobacteria bacterium]